MKEYTAPRSSYVMKDDGTIEAETDKVWKITGTYMGALLGVSPYETPFTMSAKMLGLWDEDISDRPAVITGKLLEERIIDYVGAKHPNVGQFFKAEELFSAREGAHEDWKSDFEDEDFAGHVDGIVSRDGQDYILEVKTVRDISSWDGRIPDHYMWQVALYNHFITRQDTAYFAVGIVTSDTYRDPYQWVPNKDNCLLIPVHIDQEKVAQTIGQLREMRKGLCKNHTTLPADLENPRDVELWTHLNDILGDVDNLTQVVDEYESLCAELDSAELELKPLKDKAETCKARIKDIMSHCNIARVKSLCLSSYDRESVDYAKARADGIDLTPYVKKTKITTLRRAKQ